MKSHSVLRSRFAKSAKTCLHRMRGVKALGNGSRTSGGREPRTNRLAGRTGERFLLNTGEIVSHSVVNLHIIPSNANAMAQRVEGFDAYISNASYQLVG